MNRTPRLRPSLRCLAGATAAALLAATALAAGPPSSGLDLGGIDRSVVPGDDFFAYANGAWLAATEIPADQASWGASEITDELTRKRTADLIQAAARGAAPGSDAARVGTYYAAFMDEASIEHAGVTPLAAEFKRIDAITDRHGLARALGSTLRADVDVLNSTNLHTANLFGLWVAQDLSDPSRYLPFLLQGGLAMPDRDYYLNPSEKMSTIRKQYQAHIATVLRLAGFDQPEARAQRVFDLETRIARAHVSREDSEDVQKGNNHWQRADFDKRAPGLDWGAYLAAAGLGQQPTFVVWQPGALTGTAALVGSEPLASWQDWLRFHYVEHYAPYLNQALANEHFEFHGHILSGTPQLAPRWKRAVDATNLAVGEAVGRLYVERYFPPSEKARAQAMVKNLLAAFSTRIDHLEWMAPQTRAEAKAKLAALRIGIGYPDRWRSYQGLEVRPADAFGNAERSGLFELRSSLRKLGTAVDRGEWVMNPQEVNAVNLPAMNALNFPAAILQPPFFDPSRPQVMDYGAIGATIGHEISHSFDDQGALFDSQGKLRNWWTPNDFAHFEAAGKALAAQFDAYRPFPDVHVNGKQTLSENIADVAGLSAAYDAWHLSLGGAKPAGADNFSAEQLFFLSFAQSWRSKIREAAVRRQIVTNGHAPDQYRADTVRNLDPWYAAFGVKAGQKLYLEPAARVRVW